jgi:hypothetical protein
MSGGAEAVNSGRLPSEQFPYKVNCKHAQMDKFVCQPKRLRRRIVFMHTEEHKRAFSDRADSLSVDIYFSI